MAERVLIDAQLHPIVKLMDVAAWVVSACLEDVNKDSADSGVMIPAVLTALTIYVIRRRLCVFAVVKTNTMGTDVHQYVVVV